MNYKKLSFITLALIGIFFFGCSKDDELPIGSNYETFTGELKSLAGIKINKQISHFFETDDGDVLYAYSDKYDLNDEAYFGKNIDAYGLVMTYESIDKDVFEIIKISEAKIEDETEENIEVLEYLDTGLGIKFSYPSNWEIEEFVDSIKLTAPIATDENENENENEDEDAENETSSTDEVASTDVVGSSDTIEASIDPDYIIIALTDSVLNKGSEDSLDDRASEIRDFARSNYDNLVGVESELSYLGVDQVFAVKYKLQNGDIYYFTPKNSQLFEISFNHPSEEDRINNTNIFSEIISSFRFIPEDGEETVSEDDAAVESNVEPDVDSVVEKEDSSEEDEDEQEDIVATPDGYREFESTPYQFKINYPDDWYYSGGNGGYDFHNEPIEEDTDALIRLDMNNSGSEGSLYSGDKVLITVKKENRYYTVSGPKILESVVIEMANSITETIE